MGAKLSVSIFVNHGIMSSQITLQTSPTAEDGNSNTIEAVVESTDKVIDSPFMEKVMMVFMKFNLRKHMGLTRILVAALTSTKRKK